MTTAEEYLARWKHQVDHLELTLDRHFSDEHLDEWRNAINMARALATAIATATEVDGFKLRHDHGDDEALDKVRPAKEEWARNKTILLNVTAAAIIMSNAEALPSGSDGSFRKSLMVSLSADNRQVPPGLDLEKVPFDTLEGEERAGSPTHPKAAPFLQKHVVNVLKQLDVEEFAGDPHFSNLVPERGRGSSSDWSVAWTQADVASFSDVLLEHGDNSIKGVVRALLSDSGDYRFHSRHGFSALKSSPSHHRLRCGLWTTPMVSQFLRPDPDLWKQPIQGWPSIPINPKAIGSRTTGMATIYSAMKIYHVHMATWIARTEGHWQIGPKGIPMKTENDLVALPPRLKGRFSPGEEHGVAKLIELDARRRNPKANSRFVPPGQTPQLFDTREQANREFGFLYMGNEESSTVFVDAAEDLSDPTPRLARINVAKLEEVSVKEPLWIQFSAIVKVDDEWHVLRVDFEDSDNEDELDVVLLPSKCSFTPDVPELMKAFRNSTWCWRKAGTGVFVAIAAQVTTNRQ